MSTLPSDQTISWPTLVDLLRYRATGQPNRRAYTYLRDGETDEVHLTYTELDRQARAIGARLQRRGAAGQRVLLLYPSGLEYIAAFFGCLYAGAVAVPVYPPNPARLDRTLPRLRGITLDARPTIVLTTTSVLSLAAALAAQEPAFHDLHWMATDTLDDDQGAEWRDPAVRGDTLAFLQYTSGSTSTPKGVMVSHDNLLRNEALIKQSLGMTEHDVLVGWLPLYHDMGLIGNVLQPLYTGFPCVLMSPADFLQKPIRWLQAISRYGGTLSGGPNFAYELCVRKIGPEQRAALDLRSWNAAFNGAEPIRPETLDRFTAAFEPCGFRREAFFPCYGLAEATLFVSGGPKAAPPAIAPVSRATLEHKRVAAATTDADLLALVGCGQTWPEQRIAIVDPEARTRCAPDQIGEIWISGPCVAHGYWNRPAATEETFRAFLADTGEGPFLRTGDLGFVQNGELFVTSRLKDLIIIRGRNHTPQDIERTAEASHPALRPGCGAAFSIDVGGEERLVIVHEVERRCHDADVEEVAGAIRQAVAERHELQVYAVVLLKTGSIPKTSSGKLQHHACRNAFLSNRLEQLGSSILDDPDDEAFPTEEQRLSRAALLAAEPARRQSLLVAYLRARLGRALGVTPSRLGADQPFTTLGLDSVKALELKSRIETDLEMEVPLVLFIEQPTVARLASALLDDLTQAPLMPDAPAFAGELLTRLDQLSDEEVDTWLQRMAVEESI